MRISSLNPPYHQQGFTLVEIMAVVFLIGIMAGMVAIQVGGTAERQLQAEAQRLYQKVRLLAEEAEFSGAETGLSLTEAGYEFFQFDEFSFEWVSLTESGFSPVVLEEDYRLVLDVDGEKLDTELLYRQQRREKSTDYGEKSRDEPEIMFFSDGQLTPFELQLTHKHIPRQDYVISGVNPGKLNIVQHGK